MCFQNNDWSSNMLIRGSRRRTPTAASIIPVLLMTLPAVHAGVARAQGSPAGAGTARVRTRSRTRAATPAEAVRLAMAGDGPDVSELQEVVVTAKEKQLKSLKQKAIYESSYGDKALDRQQLKSAGVVGGAAQALSFAPGINVSGYGQTGGTKASISVNGISQGWAGASPGVVDNGGIAISFDGIPMNNPITGLWETPQVPQTALLQGARVTYGPGDAENRWFDNIGGAVNFVPIQPADQAGGTVQLTGGSFSTENADLILQTGKIHGWETVIAGGGGRSNSFRTSPDGFDWPTRNYAGFFKTRKVFSAGNVSFGAYLGDGHGWRPTLIPTTAVAGVSVNGAGVPGAAFSEQTTGYYSAVNENVWRKDDFNRTWILYARQNFRLDERMTLHNQLWYRQGDRLHLHYNDYIGTPPPSNLYEWNDPKSHDYGDKLWSDIYLPYDQVSVGGYVIKSVYNTLQHFYNPADCYTYTGAATLTGYGVTINPGNTFCGSTTFPDGGFRNNFWYVTHLAAFVQDAITPISSLTITPGIRAVTFDTDYYPDGAAESPYAELLGTYYKLTGGTQEVTPSLGDQDHGVLPAASTHFSKTEPSISVRYQPFHWTALYANWATSYRLPPVGGGGGLYQKQPAVGDLLEKGVEWQVGGKLFWPEVGEFSKVLINLNYYHLHFSNQYISSCTTSSSNNCAFATGDSLYHGINLSAEANLGALKMFTNLNVEKAYFANYSLSATQTYQGLPVSDVPKSTFNIGAYWTHRLPGGIALKPRAWYQFVGEQAMWDNGAGAPSNQYLPSYGVLNMALAATLPSSWYDSAVSSVKLKVEVMNVLDRQYNTFGYLAAGGGGDIYGSAAGGYVLAYPGAPRAVYGTVSVRF
jgi:iron complex outermembrane recepter protein